MGLYIDNMRAALLVPAIRNGAANEDMHPMRQRYLLTLADDLARASVTPDDPVPSFIAHVEAMRERETDPKRALWLGRVLGNLHKL